MRAGGKLIAVPAHRGSKIEVMFSSVQLDNATQLDRRLPLWLEAAYDSEWGESGLRVFPGLKNILVHFSVQRSIGTPLALRVNDQQAAGLACSRVEADGPALQLEGPMHRVKNFGQGEFNLRLRGVEFQHRLLRM